MNEIKCTVCEPYDAKSQLGEDVCDGCYIDGLMNKIDYQKDQMEKLKKSEKHMEKELRDNDRVWYALHMGDTMDLPKRLQKKAQELSNML